MSTSDVPAEVRHVFALAVRAGRFSLFPGSSDQTCAVRFVERVNACAETSRAAWLVGGATPDVPGVKPVDYGARMGRVRSTLAGQAGPGSGLLVPLTLPLPCWPDVVEVVVARAYEGLFRGGVLIESSVEEAAAIAFAGLRLQVVSGANRQYGRAIAFAKREAKLRAGVFVLIRRDEVEIIADLAGLASAFSRAYAVIGVV